MSTEHKYLNRLLNELKEIAEKNLFIKERIKLSIENVEDAIENNMDKESNEYWFECFRLDNGEGSTETIESFTSENLIDAIEYCEEKSKELKEPLCIDVWFDKGNYFDLYMT